MLEDAPYTFKCKNHTATLFAELIKKLIELQGTSWVIEQLSQSGIKMQDLTNDEKDIHKIIETYVSNTLIQMFNFKCIYP